MSRAPEEEATTIVPIFKTIPSEVEKLLAKLKEKIVETGRTEIVEKSNVDPLIALQNIFMDITSSTTSDVIVSPFVAEQTILTDASVIASMIEDILRNQLMEFRKHLNDNNNFEAIRALSQCIALKEMCLKAMILLLKKRLTHIYVNMPSKIRPTLATAMIGYDIIEQ